MNRDSHIPHVVVFGVFDVLHPGHLSFLNQAARYGTLMVVVARDSTVLLLKKKKPRFRERVRVAHLKRELGKGTRVVLGDRVMGNYTVLKRYTPDLICLGYDQSALYVDLRGRMREGNLPRISLRRLRAHKPHHFHSSFLISRVKGVY